MVILNYVWETICSLAQKSGLAALFAEGGWRNAIMIFVACVLFYLAIKKEFEPLLLLPIAFGMLLANLPLAGLTTTQSTELIPIAQATATQIAKYGVVSMTDAAGVASQYVEVVHSGGLFYYLYLGVKLGIYPPLIFLGIGAMTDFAPLIANPRSFLLGAAAQVGIFVTFVGALLLGFDPKVAASIAIIGGADGPTAIYVTSQLAADYLGPIAIAAYSYMALIPLIQPPIMKALTTRKERLVVMEQSRSVTKLEKIVFPVIVTIVVALLLPDAAPLVGMLMLGNLFRESGVVSRISSTAQNELMNIITIFLGVSVGATATGEVFLSKQTLFIIGLGLLAFCISTASGVLFGKLMYVVTNKKINPLIGSAGVSAVPMAARMSQRVGQEYCPTNYLLMHAMGPNVAGVIGSAIAAGVLLAILNH